MRLPKHATVVAYVALFVAMGGSAYAATGGTFILGHSNYAHETTSLKNTGTGPALRLSPEKGTTPPFAVSNGTKITNLNADKVDGLHASAFEPMAARIFSSISSVTPGPQPAGAVGHWTFTLTCPPSGPATFTIHGPGTVGGTTSLATGNGAAQTYVGGAATIGSGASSEIGTGAQMSQDLFLQSGSSIVHLQTLMTAGNGGLFETCSIVGAANVVS